MWFPEGGNLSYLCLGTTFLLVPETFKFKHFVMSLPATYNNEACNQILAFLTAWSLWFALLRFGWFWFILSLCVF